MNRFSKDDLKWLQSLPFEEKLSRTKDKIFEWYYHWKGQVYVSISGKDSTVLLDIVRKMFPDVPAVYVMTGLEYPEVTDLAVSHDNVTVLHPEKPFFEVVKRYGYPIISKEVSECVDQARKAIKGGKYNYRLDKINGTAKNKMAQAVCLICLSGSRY